MAQMEIRWYGAHETWGGTLTLLRGADENDIMDREAERFFADEEDDEDWWPAEPEDLDAPVVLGMWDYEPGTMEWKVV